MGDREQLPLMLRGWGHMLKGAVLSGWEQGSFQPLGMQCSWGTRNPRVSPTYWRPGKGLSLPKVSSQLLQESS